MKTALLLSGQPRFIDKYYSCIYENIIKPNNADVFIFCWDNPELSNQPFRFGEGWKNERFTPNYKNLILDLYKPKRYLFSPQKQFVDNDIDFSKTLSAGYGGGAENPECAKYWTFSARSMWYAINLSYILATTENEYDCFIKHRFDIGISRPIIAKNYDLNKLWAEDLGRPELVNNWCNFGNRNVMSKYCNIYNEIDILYRSTGGIWCNEYWIKYVMDSWNIKIGHDYWGLTLESRKL